MNNTANQDETQPQFMLMANRDLASVIILGAFVGLLTWGAGWLLGTYVFDPILCGAGDTRCGMAPQYGEITATILVAVLALLGLVRLRVFRPMLVVLAATITLWGLVGMLTALEWYWVAAASVTLYALAYGLFVWIVRIRRFWLALVVALALIIAVRLVLMP